MKEYKFLRVGEIEIKERSNKEKKRNIHRKKKDVVRNIMVGRNKIE
jgi:hypothetical protein